VKLFAAARQHAGKALAEIELPDEATVGQLRAALVEQHPVLAQLAEHVVFAVNAQYADENATIPADAEVACIPPVSGG
jgi:molybdopterin converting factor subunit 1